MKDSKILNLLSPILIIGTTILVILFSRGWRLDFEEKTVIATGILDITSEPRGATIYINGEKKGKTPTVIDSLSPGKYQLELRKDLYTNWTKEIEIKEEYVSKITANLFEEENELTQISDTPLENIIFSKSGNEAIVINTHNGDQGIWKTQLNESFFQLERSRIKIADLIEQEKYDLLKSNYQITANNNFSKALLQIDLEEGSRQIFLLNLLKENSEIIELTELLGDAESYFWLNDNLTIAISIGEKLETFNTTNRSLSIVSNWPIVTWTASQDTLYFINIDEKNDEKRLFQAKLDGSNREELIIEDDTIEIATITAIDYNEEYTTLLISSTDRTDLFNTKSEKVTPIYESASVLISESPDERFSLLMNLNESKSYVYDFEENTLIVFTSEIEVNPSNFTWPPNSLKLFYRYTSAEGENKLVSMDYDGTNYYELLVTPEYNGNLESEFGFSSDSKEVYFPLPVSTETDTVDGSEQDIIWEEYIFKLQLR